MNCATTNIRFAMAMGRSYSLIMLMLLPALNVSAAAAVVGGPVTNPTNGHVYYLLSENFWADCERAATSLAGC